MFKIRKATEKDLDSVVSLSEKMMDFHTELDPYYSIYRKYEDPREYYSAQLKKDNTLYVIAENEADEVVGFASCNLISMDEKDAPKIGVLVTNFVLPEFRGKGIGTQLFDYRMQWLQEHGVSHVEMNVDARNEHALTLWKSKGFKDYQVKLRKDL